MVWNQKFFLIINLLSLQILNLKKKQPLSIRETIQHFKNL